MAELSTEQVNFIERDIRSRGITIPGLHENLVDHICCILEEQMQMEDSFPEYYERTIRCFFKKELSELETETNALLNFKNYYTMRKTMILSGLFAVISLATGILFKFLYLPGTAILITLGIAAFSLVFLPLYFTLRTKERKEKTEKILAALAVFSGMVFSLSILFKVMHWPGANIMLFGTIALVGAVFLPVYLITGLRNPLTRINTVVTSVMIFIACGLLLTLAASPRHLQIERIADTHDFIRQEEILKKEILYSGISFQKGSNSPAGDIIEIANEIRDHILLETAGTTELNPDLENPQTLIVNGWLKWEEEMIGKISKLRSLVEEYNATAETTGEQFTISPTPILEFEAMRAVGALNNLFQIRMAVVQNESRKKQLADAGHN